jgi:hypothetical protein
VLNVFIQIANNKGILYIRKKFIATIAPFHSSAYAMNSQPLFNPEWPFPSSLAVRNRKDYFHSIIPQATDIWSEKNWLSIGIF